MGGRRRPPADADVIAPAPAAKLCHAPAKKGRAGRGRLWCRHPANKESPYATFDTRGSHRPRACRGGTRPRAAAGSWSWPWRGGPAGSDAGRHRLTCPEGRAARAVMRSGGAASQLVAPHPLGHFRLLGRGQPPSRAGHADRAAPRLCSSASSSAASAGPCPPAAPPPRERPYSTSASASIRRDAAASRSRLAARRSPAASNSIRVIAKAIIAAFSCHRRHRITNPSAPEFPESQQSPPGIQAAAARGQAGLRQPRGQRGAARCRAGAALHRRVRPGRGLGAGRRCRSGHCGGGPRVGARPLRAARRVPLHRRRGARPRHRAPLRGGGRLELGRSEVGGLLASVALPRAG